MDSFFFFSDKVLSASPALYPLRAMVYSMISSFHCGIMCSSFLPEKEKNKYLYARLISYTGIGILFGSVGEMLRISLEYQLLSFVSFFFFSLFTLGFIFSSFFSRKIRIRLNVKSRSAFVRGILSAFIPCHLLFFFYSFAALSGSWWLGGFILFTHALMTMPALSFGRKYLSTFFQKIHAGKTLIKILILLICFANLFHFAQSWNKPHEEVSSQWICN